MDQYRIVLTDDHAMFRHGMKRILSERSDLQVIGEAKNGLDLMNLLKRVTPHLVFLDISMPELRGIEAIAEIKRLHPNVKILILTMHNDAEYLFQAISAGADGYLLKEDAERDLFSAIDSVRKGGIYFSNLLAAESMQDWAELRRGTRQPFATESLTVRERQILKLIAEGKTSKQIGDLLCISYRTVKRHRANMMTKLSLNKTADLIRYAIQKGYIWLLLRKNLPASEWDHKSHKFANAALGEIRGSPSQPPFSRRRASSAHPCE